MENLRRLREAAGLTQVELSEKVGVHQTSLSAWELGTAMPSVNNLLRLCAALDTSADELLGRKAM